jgi:hypothetical protein
MNFLGCNQFFLGFSTNFIFQLKLSYKQAKHDGAFWGTILIWSLLGLRPKP